MRIAAVVSIALVAILAMLLAGSCAVRGNVDEGPYVDGKKHGDWVFRFANGSVREGPFVDGKNHGRWVFRHANGTVVSETTWVDGVPEY